jgi:hypothetical protein
MGNRHVLATPLLAHQLNIVFVHQFRYQFTEVCPLGENLFTVEKTCIYRLNPVIATDNVNQAISLGQVAWIRDLPAHLSQDVFRKEREAIDRP